MDDDARNKARLQMIELQLIARGIRDPRVLRAMATVPREKFVGDEFQSAAYQDRPLPIEESQTISQPYVVAWMCEAARLRDEDRALEIGTGSGYGAAVMAELCSSVVTIERHAPLCDSARERLEKLGYGARVRVFCGDGTLGWPEGAPYDAICVAAGGPHPPKSLLRQLKVGGRLIMPVGDDQKHQHLVRITAMPDGSFDRESLGAVTFVPLIGAEGWHTDFNRS